MVKRNKILVSILSIDCTSESKFADNVDEPPLITKTPVRWKYYNII